MSDKNKIKMRSKLQDYTDEIESVIMGRMTYSQVVIELGINSVDLFLLDIDETMVYVSLVKALKTAEQAFKDKEEKIAQKKRIIFAKDFLKFLYVDCKPFIHHIDPSRGILVKHCEDIMLDQMLWAKAGEIKEIRFSSVDEMGKVFTYLRNDGFKYVIQNDIMEHNSLTDSLIMDKMIMSLKSNIKDKHSFIHNEMSKLRQAEPDKYYAIFHPEFPMYYRDHYLRDQFLSMLTKIPVSKRKKTVIFGPYGPSMEHYNRMGFKMYLHFVSNDYILDNKWDIVNDLTGFYVLFDPASFTNREMDGKDQLINSKYMSVVSVALGIGFLHYYRMSPDNGSIIFLDEYDSYVYTPHKTCFYLFPKGFLNIKGHQMLFNKQKGLYWRWILGVNYIRNAALSVDMSKGVYATYDYVRHLLSLLRHRGFLTEDACGVVYFVYEQLKDYFDFEVQSYSCKVSGLLYKDDRRYVEDTFTDALLSNEKSVSTFMRLNRYDVSYKRGFYFVSHKKVKTQIYNSAKITAYEDYKKGMNKRSSTTKHTDKYYEPGPFSSIDKRVFSKNISKSQELESEGFVDDRMEVNRKSKSRFKEKKKI